MDLVVLSKDAYETIIARLDAIQQNLKAGNQAKSENFIDNYEFMQLMKISKRTAQAWRDEGKISFSQIGNKIYYSIADVEQLLQQNYNKSFKRK